MTSAIIAVGLGWVILGLVVGSWFAVGSGQDCLANFGEDYRNCVRNSDLSGLTMQAVATGAAAFGIVTLVAEGRGTQDGVRYVGIAVVAVFVGLLALACGLLWLWGLPGGLAPDRPRPYEPVSRTEANSIMSAGVLVGVGLGAVVRYRGRRRRTGPSS